MPVHLFVIIIESVQPLNQTSLQLLVCVNLLIFVLRSCDFLNIKSIKVSGMKDQIFRGWRLMMFYVVYGNFRLVR